MPPAGNVIVDFAVHTGDVNRGLVEGADGCDTREGRGELLENGGFVDSFETFDFSCGWEVAFGDLGANCKENGGDYDYIWRHEHAVIQK